MTLKLPELPYAYDALAPFMSAETLQFHHDKHHQAYVDMGNKLLEAGKYTGKSIEDICKAAFEAKDQPVINNVGQHWNHLHFWQWMKKDGGGKKMPGSLERLVTEYGGYDKMRNDFVEAGKTQFGSGWCWLVTTRTASLRSPRRPTARTPSCTGRSRSSAAMCGSTAITSTIAMLARNIWKRSSTIWSIGTTSSRCSLKHLSRVSSREANGLPFCVED